jgi:hypothetical protein
MEAMQGGLLLPMSANGKMAIGNSHQQGGILVGENGQPQSEIEGGEVVVSIKGQDVTFSAVVINPKTGHPFSIDAAQLEKQRGKYEKIYNDKLELLKRPGDKGLEAILDKLNGEIEQLYQLQEQIVEQERAEQGKSPEEEQAEIGSDTPEQDELAQQAQQTQGQLMQMQNGGLLNPMFNNARFFRNESRSDDGYTKVQNGGLMDAGQSAESDAMKYKRLVQDKLEANKHLNFVDRIINNPNEEDPTALAVRMGRGSYGTHFMEGSDYNGQEIAYPRIVQKQGKDHLTKMGSNRAYNYALKSGEYIPFDSIEDSNYFGSNYKRMWDKKQMGGVFKARTQQAKKLGYGDNSPYKNKEAILLPNVNNITMRKTGKPLHLIGLRGGIPIDYQEGQPYGGNYNLQGDSVLEIPKMQDGTQKYGMGDGIYHGDLGTHDNAIKQGFNLIGKENSTVFYGKGNNGSTTNVINNPLSNITQSNEPPDVYTQRLINAMKLGQPVNYIPGVTFDTEHEQQFLKAKEEHEKQQKEYGFTQMQADPITPFANDIGYKTPKIDIGATPRIPTDPAYKPDKPYGEGEKGGGGLGFKKYRDPYPEIGLGTGLLFANQLVGPPNPILEPYKAPNFVNYNQDRADAVRGTNLVNNDIMTNVSNSSNANALLAANLATNIGRQGAITQAEQNQNVGIANEVGSENLQVSKENVGLTNMFNRDVAQFKNAKTNVINTAFQNYVNSAQGRQRDKMAYDMDNKQLAAYYSTLTPEEQASFSDTMSKSGYLGDNKKGFGQQMASAFGMSAGDEAGRGLFAGTGNGNKLSNPFAKGGKADTWLTNTSQKMDSWADNNLKDPEKAFADKGVGTGDAYTAEQFKRNKGIRDNVDVQDKIKGALPVNLGSNSSNAIQPKTESNLIKSNSSNHIGNIVTDRILTGGIFGGDKKSATQGQTGTNQQYRYDPQTGNMVEIATGKQIKQTNMPKNRYGGRMRKVKQGLL